MRRSIDHTKFDWLEFEIFSIPSLGLDFCTFIDLFPLYLDDI